MSTNCFQIRKTHDVISRRFVQVAAVVLLALLAGEAVESVFVAREDLLTQMQLASPVRRGLEPQKKRHSKPAKWVIPRLPPLLKVSGRNARYMADPMGNIVFLAGDYRNTVIQAAPSLLDWSKYIDWARSHGYTALRLMMNENGGCNPERYQRSSTCCADDRGNKFDLNSYNQALLERVRARAIDGGENGMYVIVTLWGGAYFTDESRWPASPFKASNNINSINGDPLSAGYGDAIWFYSPRETSALVAVLNEQKKWDHALVDQVNDLDNVIYEVCNECAWTLPSAYSGSGATANAWANEIIADLRRYEATKPKQHPIVQSIAIDFQAKGMQSSRDLIANSKADILSPGVEYEDPPVNDTPRVMINDTDHQDGRRINYRDYPWKSFTRGLQMLHWDATLNPFQEDSQSPARQMRIGIAGVLQYAAKMDLTEAVPSLTVASTKYALAHPGREYLIYSPTAESFTVDLSAGAEKTFDIEWNNPANNTKAAGHAFVGGRRSQSFISPFAGPAVLYLKARMNASKPSQKRSSSGVGPGLRRHSARQGG